MQRYSPSPGTSATTDSSRKIVAIMRIFLAQNCASSDPNSAARNIDAASSSESCLSDQ